MSTADWISSQMDESTPLGSWLWHVLADTYEQLMIRNETALNVKIILKHRKQSVDNNIKKRTPLLVLAILKIMNGWFYGY